MAYIVFGHASEKLAGTRPTVPAGCMLVLTEECGMTSILPHYVYPILADPANTPLFRDPVAHKAAIERLLRRPIRIYVPGSEYPDLKYTLLSYTPDYKEVEPSGVFSLPTPEFVFHPAKHGDARYTVSEAEVLRAFEGAMIPSHPIKRSLKHLTTYPPLQTTQSALFKKHPGVYYSLLCRAIDDETRMKQLITQHFPEYAMDDIFTVEGDDPFQTAAYWLSDLNPSAKQRSAVTEIQQIIHDVTSRRKASGSPLGDSATHKLMTLLAMRKPSANVVRQQIASLDIVDRPERRHGYTPLMMAALMGHTEAVSALLARGASVNARDNEGSSPLMFARTADIAMMLLDKGADPLLVSEDGVTALHIASGKDSFAQVVQQLLKRGADPNAVDHDGDTPLHITGSREIAEILISAGANPNIRNKNGLTPLMTSIQEEDTDVAIYLISRTDLATRSGLGTTALGYAIKARQDDIAMALVEAGNPVNDWDKIIQSARQYGLHKLEHIARKRGRRRRYTVKKSSRH